MSQSGVSDSQLSFRVFAHREDKAFARDERRVEIAARDLWNEDVERKWLGQLVKLSLFVVLSWVVVRVGEGQLTIGIAAPREELGVGSSWLLWVIILIHFKVYN